MPDSAVLLGALKRELKVAGLTYRDVARRVEISEATVKRMFNGGAVTLDRLDQLCELVGTNVVELARQAGAGARELTELSEEQEREIVSDPKLLVVAFLLIHGWSADDIAREYALTQAELIRALARLDKLRLIELLPKNAVRLLISPRFAWRKDGPINRFILGDLLQEFMRSRFAQADEHLSFHSGMLTRSSMLKLMQKLEELTIWFNELNESDRHVPHAKRIGFTMLVATRPWRSNLFERIKK